MAAVSGFAFMTSSAVGGGGADPKDEWGLPAAWQWSTHDICTFDEMFANRPLHFICMFDKLCAFHAKHDLAQTHLREFSTIFITLKNP